MILGPSVLDYRKRLAQHIQKMPPAPFPDPGRPRFTIVTIVLNAEKTLRQTITSVLDQNYTNCEYIIVDGGSRDGSHEIIKSFGNKITYWFSEPDTGIYDAFNKGVALARGDWIGILNADDWYADGVLNRVAQELEMKTSGDSRSPLLLFGQTLFWESEKPSYLFHADPERLVLDTTVGHQAIFVNRRLHENLGLYRTDLRLASDYDFFLRAILAKSPYLKLDFPIANMRAEGASDANWRKLFKEVAQVQSEVLGRPLWAKYRLATKIVRTSVSRTLSKLGLEPLVSIYRKYFSVLKKERL